MSMPQQVRLVEVGPRDGLQSINPIMPLAAKKAWIDALVDAGITEIEVGSFVPAKLLPQLADTADVVAHALTHKGLTVAVLVPNARGVELARQAGVDHITVTISASEAYSRKNVLRSTDEAVAGLADIAEAAREFGAIDVIVSCAFGSPFHDVIDPSPTVAIVERTLVVMPDAMITLADTTGTATPRRVREVIDALPAAARSDLGLHLHDTRATALANALAAIDLGISRFDTAVGGLGGSPFAPGAGGNLATEDLVLMLDDMGLDTGIDLDALLEISRSLVPLVGHDVPSRVSAAGALPEFGPTR